MMQMTSKIQKAATVGKSVDLDPRKNTKKRIKLHTLDIYIIFCFVCIIIYTVVHTTIFYKTGIEATVLDALFYGVFGGEVLLCALLKRLKLKNEHEMVMKGKQQDIGLSEDRYEEG